jgi:hypothetical protein
VRATAERGHEREIESAQAVSVSAEERKTIREFVDDVLRAERGAAEPNER